MMFGIYAFLLGCGWAVYIFYFGWI